MVSSALKLELQELLDVLQHLRKEHAGEPDYEELRSVLPSEWPI